MLRTPSSYFVGNDGKVALIYSIQLMARFIGKNIKFICRKINFIGKKINFIGKKINFIGKKINFIGKKINFIGKKINFIGKKINFIGKKINFIGKKVNSICKYYISYCRDQHLRHLRRSTEFRVVLDFGFSPARSKCCDEAVVESECHHETRFRDGQHCFTIRLCRVVTSVQVTDVDDFVLSVQY